MCLFNEKCLSELNDVCKLPGKVFAKNHFANYLVLTLTISLNFSCCYIGFLSIMLLHSAIKHCFALPSLNKPIPKYE